MSQLIKEHTPKGPGRPAKPESKFRTISIGFDERIIQEFQKVCGQIETEFGVPISRKYLAETLFIDYLRTILGKAPDPEGQKYLYFPIGGYRPTQKEAFLPPIPPKIKEPKPEREDIKQCQLLTSKESDDGGILAQAISRPSSG